MLYLCIINKRGRDAGVVERTALEMRHTGNRIQGSNPCLSAYFLFYRTMKKVILTLVVVAITLSSCGSFGFGISAPGMGGMIGGTLGSIAGDATGGRYGSQIGGLVGSIAGIAVGAAIEEQQYKERMEQQRQRTATTSAPVAQSTSISPISLTNFYLIDENDNGVIESGEECKITFDVENNGKTVVKDITPMLELMSDVKGIKIGKPTVIEFLSANSSITYSVPIVTSSHLKTGEVDFRAYAIDGNGAYSESIEFTLPTQK